LPTKLDLTGATTPPEEPKKIFKTTKLSLPIFQYAPEVRENAAGLLKAGNHPDGIDWSFSERARLKAELKAALDKGCGCDFEKYAVDKATAATPAQKRELIRWFLENKKVLASISSRLVAASGE